MIKINGKKIMRTKVIVIVVVMITLCTCISFSNDLSTQKVLRIFASLYSPTEQTRKCRNVMTFGDEHLDCQPYEDYNYDYTKPITTENAVDDSITGRKIYK